MRVERLPLSLIRISPHNVRKELGDIQGLAESIEQNGLLHPLVVVKDGELYKVVAGVRRFIALSALRCLTAPCNIVNASYADEICIKAVENIQRKKLAPIELAELCQNLQNLGWSHRQMAMRLAKSETSISQAMTVAKASPETKEAINVSAIPLAVAAAITKLPEPEQVPTIEAVANVPARSALVVVNDKRKETAGINPVSSGWRRCNRDYRAELIRLLGKRMPKGADSILQECVEKLRALGVGRLR